MRDRSKTLVASASGVLAAFLGALCCAGPLVFATIGVSAGLASRFEPLRPLFGVIMLGALAVAYRRVYSRPSSAIAAGDSSASCAVPTSRRRERILLWSAAALALALWTFPSWSRLFV